jgi:SMODS domain-containing protein
MALTTAKAFEEFKAKLVLTDTQKDTVKSRHSTSTGYLEDAFPSSGDLPLRTTYLMGSAGRETIIRPLDDIDVLAIFDDKDNIFDRLYRYDSQKFLYRVRDALNAYKVEVVGARGQAVRLFYKAAPHVDIAPVFKWSGGGCALPNGSGEWLTTDPYAHDDWISQRHKDLNHRLKPMVRMLKRWNNVHSKYLKGFHLEVVTATVFSSLGSDSRDACEKFFQCAQNSLYVLDPAGHGGDLSAYLTLANRAAVLSNLESARARAAKANAAEASGDHGESIRLWRIIFGDEFPSYG